MKLSPENKTIKSMFRSYPIMSIPNFQRDYSWGRDYYGIFLQDAINSLIIGDEEITNTEYFIGTMVFSGSEKKDEYIEVIDGQQRLTVITILLSVITSKFLEIGENELAEATFSYIKTKDDYGRPIPKLKSITSYPYFEAYVQSLEKTTLLPSNEEETNIKETYDYFLLELKEENLRKKYRFNDIAYKDILIAIRDQILIMNVISILTEDKELAYKIFEILNAKGKNLASIDLIKNRIYEIFHADENAKDKTIEKQWEKIKIILRERDQDVGMATFFRHFWLSKYQKTTHVKLYDSFIKHIKINKDSYEKFVEDLHKEAANYMKIVNPNASDYDNRKEYNWLIQSLKSIELTFGVSQARIALLALIDLKSKEKISNQQFKGAVMYIENFIFAYSGLLKNQANIYEARFSKLAINLRKSTTKNNTNKILEQYLYKVFADRFPNKDEFVSTFSKLQYSKSNNATNTITKYALNKIAARQDNRDNYFDDSSIEHIINEDPHNKETLSIGNLICLEIALNCEADNLSFKDKVDIYKKSKYHQVMTFCSEYEDFTEEDIRERATKLGEYYYTEIFKK
ncbi:DUF262 domain-containing protein [Gudongella oleilytica]|jgi:uncharacterized protein with ParB-like and HNH nuclease domain|uniref:DUF262 domain-containing protein n=1 Tax=Gudongella oleilytica TaxID=1582259 RepID=UPI002A36C3E3|nr:DUF262 domain-containing protein [Gudongella oleilytica]MDY0256615.1 DUF262 domain-containing protein [Gudongella oleilytica]